MVKFNQGVGMAKTTRDSAEGVSESLLLVGVA
jgi:hypothetical protein